MKASADDLAIIVFIVILCLAVFVWGGYKIYKAKIRKRIQLAKKNWPKLFADIFQKAKKEVWIMTAVANHDIWEKEEVIAACREAVRQGKIIHLACKWFDVRSIEIARLINEGAIKFYPLPSQRTSRHFLVNDRGQFIFFWERNYVADHVYFLHEDPGNIKPDGLLSDFSRETGEVTPVARGTFLNHLKITGLEEKEKLGAEYYLTDPSLVKTATPEQVTEFIASFQN